MKNSSLGKRFFGLFAGTRQEEHREKVVQPPTLYLHIGMPKTGTTAIQSFLFHNREVLQRDQGIYYPVTALGWYQQVPVIKQLVLSQFSQARFNKTICDVDIETWLADVIDHCRSQKIDKVIVSSEYLWAAPAMQSGLEYHENSPENFEYLEQMVASCRDFFSGFSDVKIIIYLRRQDSWLESFYNQQIKNGFGIPDEDTLLSARIFLLYYENINLWIKYFGLENVIVHTYEDAAPDVIADFYRIVGGQPSDSLKRHEVNIKLTNPRLSPRAVGIMRHAGERNIDPELLELLRIVLTNTSMGIPVSMWGSAYSVFSNEFHQKILSMYKEDTRRLAEIYPQTAGYLKKDSTEWNRDAAETEENGSWMEQVEVLLEQLIKKISENDIPSEASRGDTHG